MIDTKNFIIDNGLKKGTYNINDVIYVVGLVSHEFTFKKTCEVCDGTKLVKIKDFELECPLCEDGNNYYTETVSQLTIINKDIINNKMVFENNDISVEIYKTSNSTNFNIFKKPLEYYFTDESLAKAFCDESNVESNRLINEFKNSENLINSKIYVE